MKLPSITVDAGNLERIYKIFRLLCPDVRDSRWVRALLGDLAAKTPKAVEDNRLKYVVDISSMRGNGRVYQTAV